MLVFCSGIAGCGEKEYLKNFRELCGERGKEVEIHDLGSKILEIGRKDYPDLGKYELIKFPDSTVSAWRSAALESLKAEIQDDSKVHVLDAHASFWIQNGPQPAINTSYLKQLNPDLYIQIIDYEPDIHERLQANDELPEGLNLSLEEVVRWQEVERYTNRILSNHHQKPFHIIARQHPAENLYNLIFEPERPLVYQSFPISNLGDEHMEKIQAHVSNLRGVSTVYDPIEIDPADGIDDKTGELINQHTVKRDEQFIDQSDMVVVYFPEMVYSSGVEYEINYASKTGKPVWIIKPDSYVGPFTEYNCDRSFKTSEECIKQLKSADIRRQNT
ncbi:MAG: hypothetical protein SVV03_04015 [Candidatus Nanohaloarchaea archaeon]|nr:hypothetical protein [Candidatus Nanohaloarchaea archaeon]